MIADELISKPPQRQIWPAYGKNVYLDLVFSILEQKRFWPQINDRILFSPNYRPKMCTYIPTEELLTTGQWQGGEGAAGSKLSPLGTTSHRSAVRTKIWEPRTKLHPKSLQMSGTLLAMQEKKVIKVKKVTKLWGGVCISWNIFLS